MLITKKYLAGPCVALGLLMSCSQDKGFTGGVESAKSPTIVETDDAKNVTSPAPSVEPSPAPVQAPTTAVEEGVIFQKCTAAGANMVALVSKIPNGGFPFDLEKFYDAKPAVDDQVCLVNTNIGLTAFSDGFPGAPLLKEWFALDINFIIEAPETGEYSFSMNSDDDSAINVDGKQLEFRLNGEARKYLWGMDGHNRAPNNGRQANTADGNTTIVPAVPTEKFSMVKGKKYPVRIKYYQGPKFNIMLDMKWTTPSSLTPSYMPAKVILKPENK